MWEGRKIDTKNDFSKGSVVKNIVSLAIPMTAAQLINVLYNIVDRLYIARIPKNATLAMTGLGLCLPIISIITAFANLFGMGGSPLSSIERGRGNDEEAEKIMGNSFFMLLICGVVLTTVGFLWKEPLLFLFGASEETFPYADKYLTIYLCGSIFVMTGLGMNSFINAQGFGKTGMMTVLLGAIMNLILDPIFIFGFDMGVQGAALATVISQFVSSVWILLFLTGKRTILRLRVSNFRLKVERVKNIISLGMSAFIMAVTNGLVQIVCNATLQQYGGDLYVGIMTVVNSIREVVSMPVSGVTHSAQPVMGYNYGAKKYKRVWQAIKFTSISCIGYTSVIWGILFLFPEFFISLFNQDAVLIEKAVVCVHTYFFGFFMMSLQFSGQCTFVGLGRSRYAMFFSTLRKVVIVIPLTLLLPKVAGLGTMGVFLAEPISNFIGGTACFVTMLLTVGKEMRGEKSA
ncbi:MAG: MATE family efflux transporter [Lachnospiraceae bacterium]|nr:MATE family efflux transporter [Robinsoniella sp.]MDY3767910.1 MATE family efflux transporter [Lachnospiraceae bacterium]